MKQIKTGNISEGIDRVDTLTPSTKEEEKCDCIFCREIGIEEKTGGEVEEESSMLSYLKEYFATTPKDVIKADWEEVCKMIESDEPSTTLTDVDETKYPDKLQHSRSGVPYNPAAAQRYLQHQQGERNEDTEVKWDATDKEMNEFALAHAANILDTDFEKEAEEFYPYKDGDHNNFNTQQYIARQAHILARKMSLPNKKSAEIGWGKAVEKTLLRLSERMKIFTPSHFHEALRHDKQTFLSSLPEKDNMGELIEWIEQNHSYQTENFITIEKILRKAKELQSK